MKKHDENLFQIGEVSKILGVSRKIILNYEELGLLTPAVKDEVSGYRYYTADNMTHIRSIRTLQLLGLSLREVAEYYTDTTNIDQHLERLIQLRDSLDRSIEILQVRAAKSGDFTVRFTTLPKQVCFCQTYDCADSLEAAQHLRETYIAAARTGYMSMTQKMFTIRQNTNADLTNLLCCIPVNADFEGPERCEFDETLAVCIYFRGPYHGIINVIHTLNQYIADHNLTTAGNIRSIYLEGPPNHGDNSANYITQVAVPIVDRRRPR